MECLYIIKCYGNDLWVKMMVNGSHPTKLTLMGVSLCLFYHRTLLSTFCQRISCWEILLKDQSNYL